MLHHETFWLLLALIVSHLNVLKREQHAALVRMVQQKAGIVPVIRLHRRAVQLR
jgi:hypothetical protein